MKSIHLVAATLALSVFVGCECAGPNTRAPDAGEADDAPDAGNIVSPVLDPSFGDEGVASARGSWSVDTIYAAARAPDGTITTAGATFANGYAAQLLIGRLSPDGQPDASFGVGGTSTIALYETAMATGVAVLADGAVVVSGNAILHVQQDAFVGRLDARGDLDTSFGDGGFVRWEAHLGNTAVAVDAGGRVLVASEDASAGAVLRCLGADGSVEQTVTLEGDSPRALVVLDDGRILALSASASSDRSWLERRAADCSVDGSFASGGVLELDFVADDVAVDPRGADLLVSGGSGGIARLTGDGVPDSSFVGGGAGRSVAWLPSGDIFLAQTSGNNFFPDVNFDGVVRLADDGTALPFDGGATTGLTGGPALLLPGADGVLVVGTERANVTPPQVAQQRWSVWSLAADGTANTSFGRAGLGQASSTASPDVMWDMARVADGSIVVAATVGSTSGLMRFVGDQLDVGFGTDGFAPHVGWVYGLRSDGADGLVGLNLGGVRRFAADGSPDPAFLPDALHGQVRALTVDDSGRIVVSGAAYIGNDTALMVARYQADGALDQGFGDGGVAQLFDGVSSLASSVFVDADGAVLAAGEYFPSGQPLCARFTADGVLDGSFGDGGVTTLNDTASSNDVSRIVARRAGGYLIAVRDVFGEVVDVFALDTTGARIGSFGDDGLATAAADGGGPFDMLELDDGRVLVAKGQRGERSMQLVVSSLRPDGQVDTAFADGGRLLLPGQGQAVRLVADGDGVLVGGYLFQPSTGTDVALLRLASF